MRWLARLVAAMLLLAGLLAWFGPNLFRQQVAAAVGRALHRDVTVGDLRLLPSWPPVVQASDVAVAGLGTTPLVRAQVAATSLLTGRPFIDELRLTRPSIVVEPDGQGRLALLPRPTRPAAAVAAAEPAPATPPPRIVIDDGTLVVRDRRIGPDLRLAFSATRTGDVYDLAVHGTLPAVSALPWLAGAVLDAHIVSGKPVHIALNARYRNQDFHAVINTAAPDVLATGRNLPVTLTATGDGATLHANGTVGDAATRSGLDLKVSLRADDERGIAALFGWPRAVPGTLSADARVSGGPASYTLRDLALQAPQGDLAGDVTLTLGARPAMRGVLRAQRLELDAALAAASPPAAEPAPAPAATAASPPPAPWLIPDRPLPLGQLGRADADVTLSAAALRVAGVQFRDLASHLVLQHGRLALDPFAATLPGGAHLDATAHLDGPAAAVTLHAPALSLAPTLAALHLPAIASGIAVLDADLHASGATPHALAGSLEGKAALKLAGGAIDGQMFAMLLHRAHVPGRIAAGPSQVSCAAVGFAAHGGVLDLAPMVVETARLRIDAAGSVDLGRETMALQLQPLVRSGIGLVIPVRIEGPWRTPRVAVGAGSDLPPSTACPADTLSPAALFAPGKKHPKTIDVLRGLLR